MKYMLSKKTAAMYRLMGLVDAGYTRYVNGQISIDETYEFYKKLVAQFDVNRDRNSRYRFKKIGICSTKLVMWFDPHDEVVHWWLLSTKGKGFVVEYRKISDATKRSERLCISSPEKYFDSPSQYELVRTSRKNTELNKGATRWTWRLTGVSKENLSNEIEHSVSRRQMKRLSWQIDSLRRTPGFHLARREGFALYHQAKKQWKSTQRNVPLHYGEWPLDRKNP